MNNVTFCYVVFCLGWEANAALSGEQRDHNPKSLRLKHKTQPRAETPKRWESVLNA